MTELTPKQRTFLLALINAPTQKQAIENANIAESTAYRYLKDPVFNEEYRKLKRVYLRNVTTKLQYYSNVAINTLVEIAKNKNVSPYARVQSARTLLEFGFKGYEIEELEHRLEELENEIEREDKK
ncbi:MULTISPECIES: phage replication protein [unclassified Gemella]|uniref:phage replication protein n=1 Tax=unclassified Gemella TaxID=2624949 RepID=UPI00107346DF|nr:MULTISPECIES: phage replication protein [unclassified Gemella]MBF0710571.1 phage replication protein [Gemella sp. GL1.1]MBF0746450.1 phage replication protein [Gemella sp. 19428wG2_WT2a]NYS27915.1 phage replication protein [Gemella sp. GL1]TFU60232.1 phage replication protein [Gemella sp. WT2a]